MPKASSPALISLLEDAGYRVIVRTEGWHELFLQREKEVWVGRGLSEDEAIINLLGQMFPSHLARSLFDEHVGNGAAITMGPQAAPNPGPAEPAQIATREPPPSPPPPSAPPVDLDEAITHEFTPIQAAPREEEPAAPPEAVVALDVGDAGHDLPPVSPAHALGDSAEKAARAKAAAEAVDSVENLLTDIEARLPHLARMNGERQRLYMLVWICRARAVEEAHPGARDVEHTVAKVARRLTEIGKMFWPGSVRALQLSARPADVRREMHATWANEPGDWQDATALAQRLLDEHLTKSSEAGLDEDGWADAAARLPRAPEPDELFEAVDKELKDMLVPSGEVPNGRVSEMGPAGLDQLMTIARKLRWLRGSVKDDLNWGVAMGRLRRSIPSLGERAGRVRDILDHRTRPSVPWAKLVGADAAPAAAPGESEADLDAALTEARGEKESLLAWLVRAFDVLNTPKLLEKLSKEDLALFGEEELNHQDRRVRRRLRELVKRSEEASAPPVVKEPEPIQEEPVHDEPTATHAVTVLAERVRERTHGKRALFVSNREDPELGARLSELLGIDVTWCDGSLRRVQAQCDRIKSGSYDLVLSATGFQVHGVDSALARACGGHVPYVRVNRGRPVACIQAIAREFGLASGTFPQAAMKLAGDG